MLFLISVGGAVFLTRYPRLSVAVVGCGALICCYWYVGLALQLRGQPLVLSGYFDIVNVWSFVLAMVADMKPPIAFLLAWPLWEALRNAVAEHRSPTVPKCLAMRGRTHTKYFATTGSSVG